MINHAMFVSRRSFNPFTRKLWEVATDVSTRVMLRDGRHVDVVRHVAGEIDESGFRTEDHSMYWNLDGSSITSEDYDIVECSSF